MFPVGNNKVPHAVLLQHDATSAAGQLLPLAVGWHAIVGMVSIHSDGSKAWDSAGLEAATCCMSEGDGDGDGSGGGDGEGGGAGVGDCGDGGGGGNVLGSGDDVGEVFLIQRNTITSNYDKHPEIVALGPAA